MIPGSVALHGENQGFYTIPCNTPLEIGFQFGGQIYMMNPTDFISANLGGSCLGALAGVDAPDDTTTELVFILGALFMKNLVTVYDLGAPAVGFGRLKDANTRFGGYSIVRPNEETALGTGPFATLSPTLSYPAGIPLSIVTNLGSFTLNILPPMITVVNGTGAVDFSITQVATATGVQTSAGATVAVTSNIPAIPQTQGIRILKCVLT